MQGRRLGVLGGANAPPKKFFAPPQGILGGGKKILGGGICPPPRPPNDVPVLKETFCVHTNPFDLQFELHFYLSMAHVSGAISSNQSHLMLIKTRKVETACQIDYRVGMLEIFSTAKNLDKEYTKKYDAIGHDAEKKVKSHGDKTVHLSDSKLHI